MSFEKCINCPDRYPACQDTCEYGIGQKKRYEADKAKIRQVTDRFIGKRTKIYSGRKRAENALESALNRGYAYVASGRIEGV